MSWGSGWFKASWFTRWLDVANGVVTTVSILAVVSTDPVVYIGKIVDATVSTLTIASPNVSVETGGYVTTSTSSVVIGSPATHNTIDEIIPVVHDIVTIVDGIFSLEIGCDVADTHVTVSVTTTPVSTSLAETIHPLPSSVTLASIDVLATGGSTGVVLADSVAISSQDVEITTSVDYVTLFDTLTLTSPDVIVYDQYGVYTITEASMVKIYMPEIMAFSTDITTDMEVVDAMTTDMESIDGTQTVKLYRKTDSIVVDFTQGTAIPEEKVYTFDNALIRQISERDNTSVRQLRTSMRAIQNDDVHTFDTIIELPLRDDVTVQTNDMIYSDMLQTKYIIVAVDTCTLKTRIRVGARRLA